MDSDPTSAVCQPALRAVAAELDDSGDDDGGFEATDASPSNKSNEVEDITYRLKVCSDRDEQSSCRNTASHTVYINRSSKRDGTVQQFSLEPILLQ